MSDSIERKQFSLGDRLAEYRQAEDGLKWRGTFSEYFDLVRARPGIGRLSHGRVFDMIDRAGVRKVEGDDRRRFGFFEEEIFGLDGTLDQVYDYFASSARRLEVRKRILLLMGPVGGGKSSIVALIKRGLEAYSQTDEGAAFRIKGCPMNEDPNHLIPEPLRPEIHKELGLYIEGGLCPHCRMELQETYHNRAEDVLVERFTFSEKDRRGIGTFSPSDPKSQDITELTGSINLSTIGEYGAESDPRAFRFDGELNIANRGVMEFIEMLKCDEKFLYGLLTLSQEQSIKTGRFAMIYADEVILSHTNENEFTAFLGDKRSEALQDRLIVVRVPYNLRVSDEVRIYQKLLAQSSLSIGSDVADGQFHVAPGALELAATVAVLSRLEDDPKMTRMQKLRLYDGQEFDGFKQKDVKEMQQATIREGMDGISPRYVINRLSTAMVRDGIRCMNPIAALRVLRDGLDGLASISTKEQKEALLKLMGEARVAYDDRAKRELQGAFVYNFEESASSLCSSYLDNIEAFVGKRKVKDPTTDEDIEPDEKLMRSIEEQIGVAESAKKAFREEVLIKLSSLARQGQVFDYRSHDRLKVAIEKKLFADVQGLVKTTLSTKTPDGEQQKRIAEVTERLIRDNGYCVHCAGDLLKYVGTLLNR